MDSTSPADYEQPDQIANQDEQQQQTAQPAASKWTQDLEMKLLRIVKLVENTRDLAATTRGGYAKQIEHDIDWDLVAEQLDRFYGTGEDEPFTGEECRQRLLLIFHKIPKQKPLIQLIEEAESAAWLKYMQERRVTKNVMDVIWRNHEKVKQNYILSKAAKNSEKGKNTDLIEKYAKKWVKMNPVKKFKLFTKMLNLTSITIPKKPKTISQSKPALPPAPTPNNSHLESIKEEPESSHESPSAEPESSQPVAGPDKKRRRESKKPKYVPLEGEPRAPALNPYAYFTKWLVPTLPADIGKDRMHVVSKEWKDASEETKEKFTKECSEVRKNYLEKLAEFYRTIPEGPDKKRFEIHHKAKMAGFLSKE